MQNDLGFTAANYLVQGTKFQVDERYAIQELIKQGACGTVCAATDGVTNEFVSVKKIEGAFEHLAVAKRTVRELRILRHLQHENIVQIKNVFFSGQKNSFEDIYVVSELMEADLASTLKSSQPLSDEHCQFFLYQILRGMKYIHSAGVIHRDLKPRNICVNSTCDLKIADFGLARVRFAERAWVCPMTEYVCTRWYRAPEVLCSWTDYSAAIDIWSIGCITAELLTRKPLFPGHNTQHQLDLIIGLLGSPDAEELAKIPNDKCRKFIKSLPPTSGHAVPHLFAEYPLAAQDFLIKTLCWDSEKRLTIGDAIAHPYVEKLHCPEDEPIRRPLDTTDFEFEWRKINFVAVREEIFRESLHYYSHLQHQHGGSGYDITQYRLLASGEGCHTSDEEIDSD